MSQPDYGVARERMVREQVFERGVRDRHVLRAMLEVPRHCFLAEDAGPEAYTTHSLPIGFAQTMSQPYMVGYLAEALALEGRETILEIGTGSGYQAAVLSRLAKAVYSIERIPELGERAVTTAARLGYRNIHVRIGDGASGWREYSPFERILLTAAASEVPHALLGQLCEGGFLLGPVVGQRGEQEIVKLTRRGDRFDLDRLGPCSFVPLVRGTIQHSMQRERP
jgi:protein-L-isoaspartate(D-aspartate) O-methyltransferase